MELGNYSQVGGSEKKEENGEEKKKEDEEEGAKEPSAASEKHKVRRMICPPLPHPTKFKRP